MISDTSHVEFFADNILDEPSEQPLEMLESQTNELQPASAAPSTPLPPILPALPTPDPDLEQGGLDPEPPIDPDLLSALGACTSDTPDFGESIHNNLASIWPPLLRKGLSKEDRDNLTKEYLIPSNCKLLQAPKLNAEISAAVSDVVRGRDKKLSVFQQELGAGISAINRGLDTMLKTDNKTQALKNLSDGCRILSNLHHCLTKDRVKLIIPSLEKSFLHVIQETERDDTLFGNSLGEKIKACKVIERQGHQIRKANPKTAAPQPSTSRPAQQGNGTGPPRYSSNRGWRGGRGRAAPTAAARRPYPAYTVSTTRPTSKTSYPPKTRANVQH